MLNVVERVVEHVYEDTRMDGRVKEKLEVAVVGRRISSGAVEASLMKSGV